MCVGHMEFRCLIKIANEASNKDSFGASTNKKGKINLLVPLLSIQNDRWR